MATTFAVLDETGQLALSLPLAELVPSIGNARVQALTTGDDQFVAFAGVSELDHSCVVAIRIDFEQRSGEIVDVVPGVRIIDHTSLTTSQLLLCRVDSATSTTALLRFDMTTGQFDRNFGIGGPIADTNGVDGTYLARSSEEHDHVFVIGTALLPGESWPTQGLFAIDIKNGAYSLVAGQPAIAIYGVGRVEQARSAAILLPHTNQLTAVVAASVFSRRGRDIPERIGSFLYAYNLDEGGYPPRNWSWDGIRVDDPGSRGETVTDLLPDGNDVIAAVESTVASGGSRTPWTALGCYRYDVQQGALRIANPNGEVPAPTTTAFRGGWDNAFHAALDSQGRTYLAGFGFTESRPGLLPGEVFPSVTSPGVARWSTEDLGSDAHDEIFSADFGSLGSNARGARVTALAIDRQNRPTIALHSRAS